MDKYQEELDILLYNTTIGVKHNISFEGNITTDDTVLMIRIFKLLQEHGMTQMKHSIFLDRKQEYLTRKNTVFDKFSYRVSQYFCILKILLGYDN